MNRKLLIPLLLLPIAIFAADRLSASSSEGGGKEKHTTSTDKAKPTPQPEVTQQPAQATNNPATAEPTTTEAGKKSPEVMTKSDADLVKLVSASLEEELEEAFDAQNEKGLMVWTMEEIVPKNLGNWIDKAVREPLRAANPIALDPEASFSRCSSGYHVLLYTVDDKLTNEGWLVADSGCHPRRIGHFQYDFAARTVQVHIGANGELIPLDRYLKICKAALS